MLQMYDIDVEILLCRFYKIGKRKLYLWSALVPHNGVTCF